MVGGYSVMKIRLVILSAGIFLIGLSYAVSRPVTDKHVFAGPAASPSVAVPAPLATPDPDSDAADSGVALGDSTAPDIAPAAAPVPAATPAPTVLPTATPEPTATPVPTPQPTVDPKPLPTPWPRPCGGCGPWTGPGPHPLIMCPMQADVVYCTE